MFRRVRFGSRIAGLDLEVRGDVCLHDEQQHITTDERDGPDLAGSPEDPFSPLMLVVVSIVAEKIETSF
jgi:hypothetical protein